MLEGNGSRRLNLVACAGIAPAHFSLGGLDGGDPDAGEFRPFPEGDDRLFNWDARGRFICRRCWLAYSAR